MSNISLKIAIDLTPLRSGGENGGIKILVLSLLEQFQILSPSSYFLLLTSSWNHSELISYENRNTKCILIHNSPVTEEITIQNPLLNKLIKKLFRTKKVSSIKNFIKYIFKVYINKINFSPFKRSLENFTLHSYDIDLLFCPFSAPTYAEDDIATVTLCCDIQSIDYPFLFTPQEKYHRSEFINDFIKKSKKIICISNFTKNTLMTLLKVERAKLEVVHISIHDRFSKLKSEEIDFHLSGFKLSKQNYAFYPANYWPHKNHKILLTAYGIYRQEFLDESIDLVFTGALKSEELELRQAAKKMNLISHVHFLGFIDQEILNAVWQGCRCLIFPSFYEGFGIPLLEAMMFGKPVLSSNVCSLPEVAGDAALYFDPRKPEQLVACLRKIHRYPELEHELIQKGYQQFQKFNNSEGMARQYLDIFETIIKNTQK